MAQGRPPASYLFPKIWDHVSELGYAPSHLALKNLRLKNNNIVFPKHSRLSTKTFETKFRYHEMRLVDYAVGHDVVYLVSWHRQRNGLSALDPATELVRFAYRVNGLADKLSGQMSASADPIQELADKVGVFPDTIRDVASGRLVPLNIATNIAGQAGLNSDSVQHCHPGPKRAPVNNAECLSKIQGLLAA